jgi:hypothetical protein
MINITAEKGKFMVTCPYHEAAAVRGVPGSRWSSHRKQWVIPFSRKAAERLSSLGDAVVFERPAMELMAQAVRNSRPPKDNFPAWYKFKTKPMAHQKRALDFLWEKKDAALFMAMRTGKTKTTIDWFTALKMDGKIDHVLVFCPLSVRGSWEAQIEEHCPIPVEVGRYDLSKAAGRTAQGAFSLDESPFKAMIVGIESMATGGASEWVRQYIAENKRILCVVDESHLIKTHNANRTEKITILGKLCDYRIILTGTPIAASPLDLYSQFRFLDPDIIGYSDFYSFKARYAIMGGYENKQVIGYDNLEELMREVAPHTFQVNAEEVADLPPKVYMTRTVQLSQTSMKLYNDIKKHKIIEHKGSQLVLSNALDRLTRLSLLVNGVMTTGESGDFEYGWVSNAKINELMDLIQENPVPTVIWTTGRMELRKIVQTLNEAGYDTREIHGGVKENDRITAVDDFQSGKVRYLVANTAVGGTGIKLARARMLVYMSNSFKYVDRKQSEERATDFLNPGESVCVVDIVADGTVDTQVIQPALQAKLDVAMYVNSHIKELKLTEGL